MRYGAPYFARLYLGEAFDDQEQVLSVLKKGTIADIIAQVTQETGEGGEAE